MTPLNERNGEDEFVWSKTADRCFTTKSAFTALLDSSHISSSSIFKLIWKWPGPERVWLLLWKAAHGSFMTNFERTRRHITTNSLCPVCEVAEETLLHCFRDFGMALDEIWRCRNDAVFNHRIYIAQDLLHSIRRRVTAIPVSIAPSNLNKALSKKPSLDFAHRWDKPPPGFVALNCDGSVSNIGLSAGCGGLCIDEEGRFPFAFTHKLDPCSCLEAEVWAIYHGFCISRNHDLKKIMVVSDSKRGDRAAPW